MTSPRNHAIDGLRGLAAFGVLWFHVWLYRDDRPMTAAGRNVFDSVSFHLNLGLILFFVLSGFLLYRPFARAALGAGPRVGVGGYAVRRAARILPAYYVCIAGCLILLAIVGITNIVPSVQQLPLFLVFGQNYSMDTIMGIDPVTWTLCVEAAFYVVLPVIALVALAVGPRHVAGQAALLLALVAITIAWNWLVRDQGWNDLASKALPAYIGHFALGMLAALWLERRLARGRPALTPGATALMAGTGLAIVVCLATWHEVSTDDFHGLRSIVVNLPAALGFSLIVAAAAGGAGRSVGWLSWRPVVGLGLVSYGLYLWHLPLILVLRKAGLLPQTFSLRLIVVFGVTLVVATLSWVLLERPILRKAHERHVRRRARAKTTSEPATARV